MKKKKLCYKKKITKFCFKTGENNKRGKALNNGNFSKVFKVDGLKGNFF